MLVGPVSVSTYFVKPNSGSLPAKPEGPVIPFAANNKPTLTGGQAVGGATTGNSSYIEYSDGSKKGLIHPIQPSLEKYQAPPFIPTHLNPALNSTKPKAEGTPTTLPPGIDAIKPGPYGLDKLQTAEFPKVGNVEDPQGNAEKPGGEAPQIKPAEEFHGDTIGKFGTIIIKDEDGNVTERTVPLSDKPITGGATTGNSSIFEYQDGSTESIHHPITVQPKAGGEEQQPAKLDTTPQPTKPPAAGGAQHTSNTNVSILAQANFSSIAPIADSLQLLLLELQTADG